MNRVSNFFHNPCPLLPYTCNTCTFLGPFTNLSLEWRCHLGARETGHLSLRCRVAVNHASSRRRGQTAGAVFQLRGLHGSRAFGKRCRRAVASVALRQESEREREEERVFRGEASPARVAN